jgi:hypothetical protein
MFRIDGAGDFVGSGFYKDVAPDGACQNGRVRKFPCSHLTLLAGEFIFAP